MGEVAFHRLIGDWASALLGGDDSGKKSKWFTPITPEMEAIAQRADWDSWPRDIARPNQRAPLGQWLTWVILAGRGFGKSRSGGEWLDEEAKKGHHGEQVLLAGRTPADVRTYALNGPGGLLTHHPEIAYNESRRELIWPNGVVGIIRSGANPDEFRGFSGRAAWLDELCAWQYPEECWNNLIFGMREGEPHVCVTTTPRPLKVLKRILAMRSTVRVSAASQENRRNLSPVFISEVLEPLMGTRIGRQEINAEILEDVEGALWRLALIEETRATQKLPDLLPQLKRVVVGVDPQGAKQVEEEAATDGVRRQRNETGIVVAGEDEQSNYYVLADRSLNGTPGEWGQAVVDAYHAFKADAVVAEKNFGGDMVESNIRGVDRSVNVLVVSASRGKRKRAEPIATLYERSKVHHVGAFKEMEEEMCDYVPGADWSPNRMDAVVWALTELLSPVGKPVYHAGAF